MKATTVSSADFSQKLEARLFSEGKNYAVTQLPATVGYVLTHKRSGGKVKGFYYLKDARKALKWAESYQGDLMDFDKPTADNLKRLGGAEGKLFLEQLNKAVSL